MDALLPKHEAETLASARQILRRLERTATEEAMRLLGDVHADTNAYDLGRVAEAAERARLEVTNALITAKVHGESEEAGAVL